MDGITRTHEGGLRMSDVDFSKLLAEYDTRDMAGFTRKFVDDLTQAFAIKMDVDVDSDWSGVLCLGMGGSGAGGMFLQSLADQSGGLPFVVWRDYGVPSWWGPDWLVIATSYSGNTEETLDGVRMVLEEGGTVVGICSGGELEELLEENDESLCLTVPSGQMPRSAFGHLFGTQLAVCWALNLLAKPSEEELTSMLDRLRTASQLADVENGDGMTGTIAQTMLGKQIGIISPTMLGAAGRRFTAQLNENSDRFARPVELPEMNHNEIVAWSTDASEQCILYLTCEGMHPRVGARIDWMVENIEATPSWIIDCEGESNLESLLYATHITDWISISLALLNQVDPSSMASIDGLKAHLATIQ